MRKTNFSKNKNNRNNDKMGKVSNKSARNGARTGRSNEEEVRFTGKKSSTSRGENKFQGKSSRDRDYNKKDKNYNKDREYKKKNDFVIKEAAEEPAEISPDILIGRNAVREALKNDRTINKLLVAENAHGGSLQEIIGMARKNKIIVQTVSQNKLDLLSAGGRNQGILAYTPPVDYAELEDVLEKVKQSGEVPFFVLLDELEDPHNLGAILRTADAAGVHGIIISKRRSCPLSSTVAKTSAGAVEYVPVMRVNNVNQTLTRLQEEGFWAVGAEAAGETFYYEADLTGPLVLVIGSEGKGISNLVSKNCDFLVKIPMHGRVNSLNASNAAAIMMYEAVKQRTK